VFVVDDGVHGDRSRVVHAGQDGPATFIACGRQARRVLLIDEPQDSIHAGGVDHRERAPDNRPEEIFGREHGGPYSHELRQSV